MYSRLLFSDGVSQSMNLECRDVESRGRKSSLLTFRKRIFHIICIITVRTTVWNVVKYVIAGFPPIISWIGIEEVVSPAGPF
jgi:hypothetical protein